MGPMGRWYGYRVSAISAHGWIPGVILDGPSRLSQTASRRHQVLDLQLREPLPQLLNLHLAFVLRRVLD